VHCCATIYIQFFQPKTWQRQDVTKNKYFSVLNTVPAVSPLLPTIYATMQQMLPRKKHEQVLRKKEQRVAKKHKTTEKTWCQSPLKLMKISPPPFPLPISPSSTLLCSKRSVGITSSSADCQWFCSIYKSVHQKTWSFVKYDSRQVSPVGPLFIPLPKFLHHNMRHSPLERMSLEKISHDKTKRKKSTH